MDGNPSIVVRNGKLDINELTKARYNINELLEQLRVKGYANIADVEFAILETSGNLSVIPKSQKRPATPADLNIDTQYEGLPVPLVLDGKIQYDNLAEVNLSAAWLVNELAKFSITDVKDVFIASLDTQGKLFFQTRKEQ